MVRLAMVNNDIGSAQLLLGLVKEYDNPDAKPNSDFTLREVLRDSDLRKGLQIYAFRMLIGHLREGLKVVRDIVTLERDNNREVCGYLRRLSQDGVQSYDKLKSLSDNFKQPGNNFSKLVTSVRDALGFHYSDGDKTIERTIANLAEAEVPSVNSIVGTKDARTSRFPIADVIAVNAIAKYIWEVEKSDRTDTEEALNTAMEWCGKQTSLLYGFSREMCSIYFGSHYAI